ncbi:MAG: MDR family oxidoreductase [Rhodothermales bacterium]
MPFQALVLDKTKDRVTANLRTLEEDQLPEGDVLVQVAYSSLNYKDGLAVTGKGKIVRDDYPFVPGIDLVGTVATSESADYAPGDAVIVTGWGLGEDHWGGYAQKARVRSEWCVPLPDGMTPKAAMAIGTAGFTAMLSVMALEAQDVHPGSGEVVVTGASGGVGSIAVALLSRLGYSAVASTGSEAAHGYLKELGAARIIDRDELGQGPRRPLDSARWAGGIDTVGGATLAAMLSQTARHGAVAACGLAGGSELNTTVFPFILRGVSLHGIDSNTCPPDVRREAWQRLVRDLPEDALAAITQTIPLADVPAMSEAILKGDVRGRVVVDVEV